MTGSARTQVFILLVPRIELGVCRSSLTGWRQACKHDELINIMIKMSHRMKFNDVHTIPKAIVSLELWGVPIGPLRKPMRLARGRETRDLVEMLKSCGWWCGW